MPEIVTIDGVSLRGAGAYNVSTRTGRYSLPARRGDNTVLPGASGSRFVRNKPFEEGLGTLAVWAVGATLVTSTIANNYVWDTSSRDGSVLPWTSYNGAALASTVVNGLSCFQVTRVTGTPAAGGISVGATGIGPSRPQLSTVTVSAFVMIPVGSPSRQFQFILRDDTNNDSSAATPVTGLGALVSGFIPADGIWYRIFVTAQVKASRNLERVYVLVANLTIGDIANVRGVMINDGTLMDFFDGDSYNSSEIDYVYSGAPYASYSSALSKAAVFPASMQESRQNLENNIARTMKFFVRGHRLSTIQASQPDGTLRQAQVEWREWSEPEVVAGGTRAEWAIAYTIPGVWWEDVTATTQAATAGATLPKTLDLTSFTGMTGIIEDAVITVPGPIVNPVVTDAESGATVSLAGTVSSGQSWIVDVANATSKNNGVDVLASTKHTGGYKLFVIPNTYNLTDTPRLTLSGTGGSTLTNLSITAKRKWANG